MNDIVKRRLIEDKEKNIRFHKRLAIASIITFPLFSICLFYNSIIINNIWVFLIGFGPIIVLFIFLFIFLREIWADTKEKIKLQVEIEAEDKEDPNLLL